MTKEIYIAGALFSIAERSYLDWLVAELARSCQLDSQTNFYLPHRDTNQKKDSVSIYEADKAALEHANLVIAVIDGSDIDSGTSWEIGYANGIGIPVIGLRTDKRTNVNLMISTSLTEVFVDIFDVANRVTFAKEGGILLHDNH